MRTSHRSEVSEEVRSTALQIRARTCGVRRPAEVRDRARCGPATGASVLPRVHSLARAHIAPQPARTSSSRRRGCGWPQGGARNCGRGAGLGGGVLGEAATGSKTRRTGKVWNGNTRRDPGSTLRATRCQRGTDHPPRGQSWAYASEGVCRERGRLRMLGVVCSQRAGEGARGRAWWAGGRELIRGPGRRGV